MEIVAAKDTTVHTSDLEPHLRALLEELTSIHEEQESINARSAACAYWHAARACERFISLPPAHSPASS
jgi:hypothetical protein